MAVPADGERGLRLPAEAAPAHGIADVGPLRAAGHDGGRAGRGPGRARPAGAEAACGKPWTQLLGAVSEADRILLTLKEVEGLSLKELEKIYRVNENALKVRLVPGAATRAEGVRGARRGRGERFRLKPIEGLCIYAQRVAATKKLWTRCSRHTGRPARSRNRAPTSCRNSGSASKAASTFSFFLGRMASGFVTAAVARRWRWPSTSISHGRTPRSTRRATWKRWRPAIPPTR